MIKYSDLTKRIYWVDKKGKIDVTDNFKSIMQLVQNDEVQKNIKIKIK